MNKDLDSYDGPGIEDPRDHPHIDDDPFPDVDPGPAAEPAVSPAARQTKEKQQRPPKDMDMAPVEISAAVVAFLSLHPIKRGRTPKGSPSYHKAKTGAALRIAIQERFGGQLTLDLKDPNIQAALRKELCKELKADAKFLALITRLLKAAQAAQAEARVATAREGANVTSSTVSPGSGTVSSGSGTVSSGIEERSGDIAGLGKMEPDNKLR